MKHVPVILIIVFSLFLSAGCSSLRLDKPVSSTGNDWLVGAGSPQRVNYKIDGISPPFVPDWYYTAGGGFGPAALLTKDNVLIIATLNGELHLVNIETGKRIGRTRLGEPISGSPALYEHTLFVPLAAGNETVIAYDLLTGSVRWSKKVGPVESSLLLYNDVLYAAARDGIVYALNPSTGDIHWEHELGKWIYASPSAAGDRLFVATTGGKVVSLDTAGGDIVWESAPLATIMTTPVVWGKSVFVASRDSLLYCLDLESGETVWTYNAGSRIYSAPSIGPNHLLIGTTGGHILALDPGTGSEQWRFRANSVVNSSALIAGNFVYFVSLDRHVYVLSEHDGSPVWSYELSSRLKTTPLVWNDRLVVCAEDRRVYSFKHVDTDHTDR